MKIKAYSFKTKRWSLKKIDFITMPKYEFDMYHWENGKWHYCGFSDEDEETVKEYTSGADYGYRKYTYVGDCCIKMTGIIGH